MVQDAILKRVAVTEVMRSTMQSIREISTRGTEFGLTQAFVDEVDAWAAELLATRREKLSQWEWEYGYMYLQLRHGCAVLMGEYVRYKLHNEALVTKHEKRKSPTDYDTVAGFFMDAVDTDSSQFPEQYRVPVERFKLQIWNDLLTWHLHLNTDVTLTKGIELFEDLQNRAKSDDSLQPG